jgi:hypothetical protein
MPRLSLGVVLPVILVLATLTLFAQKAGIWGRPDPQEPYSTATAEAPRAETTGRAQVEPPAAGATPPPSAMNPVPAGTPEVQDRTTPNSATPTAPSGEPATRPGGG